MPLPFIVGGVAALAGLIGVGAVLDGKEKMDQAKSTVESDKQRHEQNVSRLRVKSEHTNISMDELGKCELEIISTFEEFSLLMERIQNKPHFGNLYVGNFKLPQYNGEKLKEISIGATSILGGLSGLGLGVAGGYAAAGATSAVVMALGTASTGTAISSLSGAAATNATLALLGGGTLAAGGGGIALGSLVLGAATLGVGVLVGGIIFGLSGEEVLKSAQEGHEQMLAAERKIDSICSYLDDLKSVSKKYKEKLETINHYYMNNLEYLRKLFVDRYIVNWDLLNEEEKKQIKITVLLVGILYEMCKVPMVIAASGNDEINKINREEIESALDKANRFIEG